MVNIKLKYNFVKTLRKFIIAEVKQVKCRDLYARVIWMLMFICEFKLVALLLALMKIRAYRSKALR